MFNATINFIEDHQVDLRTKLKVVEYEIEKNERLLREANAKHAQLRTLIASNDAALRRLKDS